MLNKKITISLVEPFTAVFMPRLFFYRDIKIYIPPSKKAYNNLCAQLEHPINSRSVSRHLDRGTPR